jgi:hypothetical protein
MSWTLDQAAKSLGISHRRVQQLVQDGRLASVQLANGMHLVSPMNVSLLEGRRRGRRLNSATAWALLWELDGMTVDWLPQRGLARVHGWLQEWTVHRIAREATAKGASTTWTIGSLYKQRKEFIMTGSSAVNAIAPKRGRTGSSWRDIANLKYGYPQADAYVRSGQHPEPWASLRGARPGIGARLRINNLPTQWRGAHMPPAVVAADILETSTDQGDRALAVATLGRLLDEWRANHPAPAG